MESARCAVLTVVVVSSLSAAAARSLPLRSVGFLSLLPIVFRSALSSLALLVLQNGNAGSLYMDQSGLDVRVPAGHKQDVTLVLTTADRARLVGAMQQGKPSCVEVTVSCRSGRDQPAALSMWVKDASGAAYGKLLRGFVEGEPAFRVQLLSQHTQGFTPGAYLLTVEGGARDSKVHLTMAHSTSVGSSGGWVAESVEQQRDRLLEENRELQSLVEKQKEFILILKRKFLEKGDALMDSQNEVLLQKAKRAKFIINTWRMKTVVPAFQSWKTYTAAKKARKFELLGKVVNRLANSQLWRAWRVWTQMIEGHRVGGLKAALAAEKGKRARQLINAWRMRSLTPAFLEWRKTAKESRSRRKMLMGKIVLRMQNAGLWQAFRHWSKMIESGKVRGLQERLNAILDKDRKKRIEAFLRKWRDKTIVPKFAAWRRYAHEHRGRKKILMGKVVLRLGNAKLWSAWRQWKRSIEDDKVNALKSQLNRHRAARAQQLISMWRMRSLTPVFKSWATHVRQNRGRKKILMGKVVLRMQNAKLWSGFRQWARAVEGMKIAAVQNSMAAGLHAQKKRRIQALMARWQKGSMVGVFRAWRTWSAQNRARKRELLGKVVRRMGSAKLWSGFRSWKKYTEWSRLDEMRDRMRNEIMASMGAGGGRGGAGAGSGDYQALLLKYRSLKYKKLSLEGSYDTLFRFLQRFRVSIAKSIEEEIHRLTHHCKCDVCQTKRKMLTNNGINEWLFQFDREMVRFKYPVG